MANKRKFGRDVAPDRRDYQLLAIRPDRIARNWSSGGWHGDQGYEPSCVGYGWAHWLHASPFRQWLNPSGVYRIAQHYDEWQGNDYDGTSVRAGAKVLTQLGAISEYRFTTHASFVANWVLMRSPMVIGVDWYEGMDEPNRAGLMSLDGKVLGGHCVCVVGYNGRSEMFRIKNSYGREWGVGGYAKLSLADMQRLLDADGEACVGVESQLKP